MSIKHWRWDLLILIILAFASRLWHLFQPVAVVFDEVYFKVYAGNYLTGAYYFDPHPPLGKQLLGGWAWLFHLNPTNLTATDEASVALRVLPALAGALIIPLFYVFLRLLKASRPTALLGATLLLLENALIVESRFVLIDSLLILFGLGAVTAYLASRQGHWGRRRILLVMVAALLSGAAVSVKWTGLTALGLIGVIWAADQFQQRSHPHLKRAIVELGILGIIPLATYFAVFTAHFHLLPKSGQGDAFMSQRFQSTLKGNANYNPQTRMNDIEKFIELNQEMVRSEESLKDATHPYGSKWYSWPFMIRGVYYWQGQTNATVDQTHLYNTGGSSRQGNIYLLGNPVVWWGTVLIIPLILVVLYGRYRITLTPYRFPLLVLTAGYLMNFLPFSRIVRVMFLYHYFFALIYSLAIAVLLLQILTDELKAHNITLKGRSFKPIVYIGLASLATAGFVYFAPLTYGIPLTTSQLDAHMWLKHWR